jgi:Sec-independent protein translocase protein TatA
MHLPGLIPLLIVLALAFLLFSRPGRISEMMEDLGMGIRGFR